MTELVKAGFIESRIYVLRGKKVIMDKDLAALYGVRTHNLNKAVKRNAARFPADFMFRLTERESGALIFQNGISKKPGRGGRRHLPYAFTEQGVAMLSGVLRSARAVQVNIAIMRAFVRMREVLTENKELARRLEAAERRLGDHEAALGEHTAEIRAVFEAIRRLMSPIQGPRPAIGFKPDKLGGS
jgi:hypothetical protein